MHQKLHRIFLAFPVGFDLQKKFEDQFLHYKNLQSFRWTPSSNLHVTLFFIGEVEEKNVIVIKENLEKLFSVQMPFHLSFEEYQFKGGKNSPSMFWAKFQHSEDFRELSEKIFYQVKDFMTIAPQHKDPIPHITLARLKKGAEISTVNIHSLGKVEVPIIDFAELWQTVSSPEGVKYNSLCKFIFKKQNENQ
ncbi:MAG: RNA 2',3'-cyclic phosphodiesterase [Bacteroidetes bacterium]|nr:RNA 2',3'-cyclic phosphodiesterase [Bacteroidota bacterium]MBL0258761.1 RNA 2',3'-cyclic phosphodiesterase [Bacteroidota bacterium]